MNFIYKKNKTIVIIILSLYLFSSCKSTPSAKAFESLSISYENFCDVISIMYDKNFILTKENAKKLLNETDIFINDIKSYITNKESVFYRRLSPDTGILNNVYYTTNAFYNTLDLLIQSDNFLTYDNFHYLVHILNNLHKEMIKLEHDRINTSEEIISDYIKYFIIFSIFFFVLCIVLLIIEYFELKQRDVKIKETSKLLDYTIKGQEEEKQRIARELHDTVAQDLRYIIQLTKQLEPSDKKQNIIDREESCLKQIRNICSSFIPQDIENKDLVSSLNDIINNIKTQSNIDVKLTILNNLSFKNMDKERFLHFFRIIQEILNNSAKHSKGTEISILIKKEIISDKSFIHLIITDDGVGIDKQIIQSIEEQKINVAKNHFGLKNIIQRVNLLKGTINFNSNSEFGTEISIIFPE